MTYGEFACKYMGWVRQLERDMTNTRNIMWAGVAPHSRKRIRPQDLMKLPSDKRFEPVDVEEYKSLRDGKAIGTG